MDEDHKARFIEEQLNPGERLEEWFDPDINNYVWIVIKEAKPCSTKMLNITAGNIKETVMSKGDDIEYKTVLISSREGPYWFRFKY